MATFLTLHCMSHERVSLAFIICRGALPGTPAIQSGRGCHLHGYCLLLQQCWS